PSLRRSDGDNAAGRGAAVGHGYGDLGLGAVAGSIRGNRRNGVGAIAERERVQRELIRQSCHGPNLMSVYFKGDAGDRTVVSGVGRYGYGAGDGCAGGRRSNAYRWRRSVATATAGIAHNNRE